MDGGFESRTEAQANGWQTAGGTVVAQTADTAAVEGTHYARTWHNQTLYTTFNVVGGRAVTIRLNARAVRVEDLPRHETDRRPVHIGSRGGPAFPQGRQPGQWAGIATRARLGRTLLARGPAISCTEGFDHVRIPIGWHHYTGPAPEYHISADIFARADQLVNGGLREGLAVMINIHHFDDFTSDPKGQTARFLAIWRPGRRTLREAPMRWHSSC